MITVNKKTNRKKIMKSRFIFILLSLFVLLVSFKKENKVYNITPVATGNRDTLISAINAKFKTAKTVSANINLVSDKNAATDGVPVSFTPNDPDVTQPLLIPLTDTKGSLRARTQLKAYLDSLIIDPKSIGLIRKGKQ